MELETNIHILGPGLNLTLSGRKLQTNGTNVSATQCEQLCKNVYPGFAAVLPVTEESHPRSIFVLGEQEVRDVALPGEGVVVSATDVGPHTLHFADKPSREPMARIVERAASVHLRSRLSAWTLQSQRVLYQPRPFKTEAGIEAYTRLELATVPIDDVGLGLVMDISTAFISVKTVAEYFRNAQSNDNIDPEFSEYSHRQSGQKGTLIYSTGKSHKKQACYFDSFRFGETCGTLGPIVVMGVQYHTLLDYYRQKHPQAPVHASDTVAMVSFRGIKGAVAVSAKLLRLRIMNDVLPTALKNEDKLTPEERKRDIASILERLTGSLGPSLPTISQRFWRPGTTHSKVLSPPPLEFAKGKQVQAPNGNDVSAYKTYFRDRATCLRNNGCFSVPGATDRTIIVAAPKAAPSEATKALANGLSSYISQITGIAFSSKTLSYNDIKDVVSQLKGTSPGVKVVVFGEEPCAYQTLSYELKDHRIKRITLGNLRRRFRGFQNDGHRGSTKWKSFIEMCALDVAQQMDAVLWIPATPLAHEAQLSIDVSPFRHYFALSLQICRRQSDSRFLIRTQFTGKSDHHSETINRVLLRDAIVRIFDSAKEFTQPPLGSLLVARDGPFRENEIPAVDDAIAHLKGSSVISQGAPVSLITYNKKTSKKVRVWAVGENDSPSNALEGSLVQLSDRRVVLLATGRATLNQGTADPLVLEAESSHTDLLSSAQDCFSSAQMNWSSPSVAQKLTLSFKRTDEELERREAKEAQRVR